MSGLVTEEIRSYVRNSADWNSFDREYLYEVARKFAPLAPRARQRDLVDAIWSEFSGFGPLDEFLSDDEVTEVMVNGSRGIWIERNGEVSKTNLLLDEQSIRGLIERVVIPLGLRVDNASPVVDARLSDGSRVHVMLPPLAIDGPYITIRRFGARTVRLSHFCSPETAEFIHSMVAVGYNILISGSTSAGKTTLLNELARAIPSSERIITIEDAAELRLAHPHVLRMESRKANVEGVGEVTIRELVRHALRMRPDRIIVGEFRGPEAFDMLQAMNTGHDGSLSTCHANSPADALRRLESMTLTAGLDFPLEAVRDLVNSAVDVVIQVSRVPDGSRKITRVDEVLREHQGNRTRCLATGSGVSASIERPERRIKR